MASKRRNMFQKNKTQETTENVRSGSEEVTKAASAPKKVREATLPVVKSEDPLNPITQSQKAKGAVTSWAGLSNLQSQDAKAPIESRAALSNLQSQKAKGAVTSWAGLSNLQFAQLLSPPDGPNVDPDLPIISSIRQVNESCSVITLNLSRMKIVSKHRNMFYQKKKQETKDIVVRPASILGRSSVDGVMRPAEPDKQAPPKKIPEITLPIQKAQDVQNQKPQPKEKKDPSFVKVFLNNL
ncbi:hypothetical protein AAG570_011540 [Ranatra chinensis]|uniref:Uncharacterized protein n=1 Tax=Ranatra chinensis TaxID=642074 RepID=A0ABD0YN26_9HEMI